MDNFELNLMVDDFVFVDHTVDSSLQWTAENQNDKMEQKSYIAWNKQFYVYYHFLCVVFASWTILCSRFCSHPNLIKKNYNI